jgi:hypothetical protein
MSLELERGRSPVDARGADPSTGIGVGKATLVESLGDAGTGDGAARAERGGGEVRAQVGRLAEGAHVGVQRGGGGGARMLGHIAGGSFVRAAPAASGPAAAAPTAATGRDGERAFVGTASVADRTVGDGTTTVRMEDETEAQAGVILAAVTRARALLDNAIGKLATPAAPQVAAALTANFHSTEAKVVAEVLSKLQRIRAAFDGTIPIEVESEGTARAYVYRIWSDIHLCPPWFADPDADARARTIIHECSHKYTGTDDKAYHWDSAKYGSLSVKDALNNADSYAWLCIDVR